MKKWIEIIRKDMRSQMKLWLDIGRGRYEKYEQLTLFTWEEGEDKGEEYVINCFRMTYDVGIDDTSHNILSRDV